MDDPVSPRFVVIVGLMGTGKTTVGRLVARKLGWSLRDSDEAIEAREGLTVREIRAQRGTDAMHDLEAAHVLGVLATPGPAVVCAAASAIDRDEVVEALRRPDVAVAWLRVQPEVAASRFAGGAHRPAFGDDPEAFLAAQAARRDPRFAAVADVTIDTGATTPDGVAAVVVALAAGLRAYPRKPGGDPESVDRGAARLVG